MADTMDDSDRRSVDELVSRYEFHPNMRDLFVEGETDKRLFRWFLSRLPVSDVVIYDSSGVKITAQDMKDFDVTEGGDKGRVITLSLMLAKVLPQHVMSPLCIVDKDFHDFGFPVPECRFLTFTDFACLECYALSSNPISKLCTVYLGRDIMPSEIDSMMEILQYVFFVRLVKRRLCNTASWYDRFTNCCSMSDGRAQLDRPAYLARISNTTAGALTVRGIEGELEKIKSFPINDNRQVIHGHDAIQLISWIAEQKGAPGKISDVTPLNRALLSNIEIDDIIEAPLFVRIAAWARSST
jgi:hypothetical protein